MSKDLVLEPCNRPEGWLRNAPRKQVRCPEGYVADFFYNERHAFVRYYNHDANDTRWMRIVERSGGQTQEEK